MAHTCTRARMTNDNLCYGYMCYRYVHDYLCYGYMCCGYVHDYLCSCVIDTCTLLLVFVCFLAAST